MDNRPYVHPNESIDYLMASEIVAINRAMREFKLDAGTPRDGSGALVSPTSYISYRLLTGPGQTIQQIEQRMADITQAVSNHRGVYTPVLLDYAPLALQVPHPSPKPLRWDVGQIGQLSPHTMALGRSFSHAAGSKLEAVSFDESPHMLVAGTTGAGKSVLMRSMITSLCANTSPEQLQIVLVDLKNEDMIPFARWPHVARFCRTAEEAIQGILQVQAEKAHRIEHPEHKPYRLVLWIDELAQLAGDKGAVEMLGDLASIGRSKLINLVAATQSPTEQGGMGAMMRSNFTLRLVGQVAPGESYSATRRKKLYADLLPGKGSFLRIEGAEVRRFQSFLITDGDIGRAGQALGPHASHRVSPLPPALEPADKLSGQADNLSDVIEAIRPVWANGGSQAEMIRAAFGEDANTGGSNRRQMLRAVKALEEEAPPADDDGKIIRMWG